MASDSSFEGWCGLDKNSAEGNMVWQGYTPKEWEETDVDIEISHCGVCGSDMHVLRKFSFLPSFPHINQQPTLTIISFSKIGSGWGPTSYPIVVGHEIVGKAIRVGSAVSQSSGASAIRVGDRVGVGAQAGSCLRPDCAQCTNSEEQFCKNNFVMTYNGTWPSGATAQGGYAKYWRGAGHFVFRIPEEIPSEEAAPMLCGGVTVYSPLKQNGVGPGKRVGVIGIGGLGHMAIMFAKALGAERVVAISRNDGKKSDALQMGADELIATDTDEEWSQKSANSLDVIICTVSSPKMPFGEYLNLLDVGGTFVQVGAPDDVLPPFVAMALIMKKVKIVGSLIGSPAEIREMFEVAARQKVKPWVQKRAMKDANQVILDFEAGMPRYRYVLEN